MGRKKAIAALAAAIIMLFLPACENATAKHEKITSEFFGAFDELEVKEPDILPSKTIYNFTIDNFFEGSIIFYANDQLADAFYQMCEKYNTLCDSTFAYSEYGGFCYYSLNIAKMCLFKNNSVVMWTTMDQDDYDFKAYESKLSEILERIKPPTNKSTNYENEESDSEAFFAKTLEDKKDYIGLIIERVLSSYEEELDGYEKNLSNTSFEDLKALKGMKSKNYQDRLDSIDARAKALEIELTKVFEAKTIEISGLLSKAESSLSQKDLNNATSAYENVNEKLFSSKLTEWKAKATAIQKKIDAKPTVLGAGTFYCTSDIGKGRYHITTPSGTGNFFVKDDGMLVINEILSARKDFGVTSIDMNLNPGVQIEIKGLNKVIFTPVAEREIRNSLSAGSWLCGQDLASGRYYAKLKQSGASGNFMVYDKSGKLKVNEILSNNSSFGVSQVACQLDYNDFIYIRGVNEVIFESR